MTLGDVWTKLFITFNSHVFIFTVSTCGKRISLPFTKVTKFPFDINVVK